MTTVPLEQLKAEPIRVLLVEDEWLLRTDLAETPAASWI
jgi:hypothetical protein